MKLTYKYLLIFAFAILAISNTACSQDTKSDNDAAIAKTEEATPQTPGLENGVFVPYGIASTGENEPLNFKWDENGTTMELSNLLKGKITFINFWGTWCPPCRAEIPHLIDLHKQYNDQGFKIIGIALERSGDPVSNVKGYASKQGINYRNFPSRDYADAFAKKFGQIQYVPTTFVVGKDGKILETIVGGRDKAAFEQIIKKYIGTN
ncbi:MAG: hypothetical protein A2X64_07525 [Ignavibacteria bacterium GWF2_33_9]|nr:MAG: hypothetical protein A2X64_07525 [Ignavibacteria bacterium GWF2_33_9]